MGEKTNIEKYIEQSRRKVIGHRYLKLADTLF